MHIDVTFTPSDLAGQDKSGRTVVVLDVVRASTTIIQAIGNGCAQVIPTATVEEAREIAAGLPPHERLLGGERGSQRLPGFDLGNSPREYTADRVRGKIIVFTTTNGTNTIHAAEGAERILIGAFANLPAVAEELAGANSSVILAAAGRLDRPVFDDIVCGGMLIQELQRLATDGITLTDAGMVALHVYQNYEGRILDALRFSASGQNLIGLGEEYQADLPFCAQVGVSNVIPVVQDGRIVALSGAMVLRQAQDEQGGR